MKNHQDRKKSTRPTDSAEQIRLLEDYDWSQFAHLSGQAGGPEVDLNGLKAIFAIMPSNLRDTIVYYGMGHMPAREGVFEFVSGNPQIVLAAVARERSTRTPQEAPPEDPLHLLSDQQLLKKVQEELAFNPLASELARRFKDHCETLDDLRDRARDRSFGP